MKESRFAKGYTMLPRNPYDTTLQLSLEKHGRIEIPDLKNQIS